MGSVDEPYGLAFNSARQQTSCDEGTIIGKPLDRHGDEGGERKEAQLSAPNRNVGKIPHLAMSKALICLAATRNGEDHLAPKIHCGVLQHLQLSAQARAGEEAF